MRGVIGMTGVLLLGLSACSAPTPEPSPSLASADATLSSPDGSRVFEARPDHDAVWVYDTGEKGILARIPVGRAPVALALDPAGRLYVANRGGRSVSVIAPGRWEEARRLEVGPEPVDLAVSPDGSLLYVLHSTSLEDADRGTLVAIDLGSGAPRWSLPVGREPRTLEVDPDAGIVVIGFLEADEEVRVDPAARRIVSGGTAQRLLGARLASGV
ncbi:MAG TPA: YncE family protein [Myxococcaceae bacterium]|nr:YncE family protein [Myxococcaceae bacterium]